MGECGSIECDGPEIGLLDLDPGQLEEKLTGLGEPAYRARQVIDWVYRQRASCYSHMSNLPARLRSMLEERLPIFESSIAGDQVSQDETRKLLLRWSDGATSECVLLVDGNRRTACVSTQVGCPVRCTFCASGLDGLQRQLTSGQIVEQVLRIRHLCDQGHRLSNIVFMGLGEPLANYQATLRAVRTINAPWGVGIGARKITISTVGVPANMRKLADEGLQVTLALSLHAPTDALRKSIVPWAQGVSIATLIEACEYYFQRTGREVTLEYALLAGVNVDEHHARSLGAIARRLRANVNLIPFNQVEGIEFQRPDDSVIQRFHSILESEGVNVHVRRSRGPDIDAACGQLRRRSAALRLVPIQSGADRSAQRQEPSPPGTVLPRKDPATGRSL